MKGRNRVKILHKGGENTKDFEKFDNYVLEFGKGLKNVKGQKERTISSRISNIKTVGQHYDVLKEFVNGAGANMNYNPHILKTDQ